MTATNTEVHCDADTCMGWCLLDLNGRNCDQIAAETTWEELRNDAVNRAIDWLADHRSEIRDSWHINLTAVPGWHDADRAVPQVQIRHDDDQVRADLIDQYQLMPGTREHDAQWDTHSGFATDGVWLEVLR